MLHNPSLSRISPDQYIGWRYGFGILRRYTLGIWIASAAIPWGLAEVAVKLEFTFMAGSFVGSDCRRRTWTTLESHRAQQSSPTQSKGDRLAIFSQLRMRRDSCSHTITKRTRQIKSLAVKDLQNLQGGSSLLPLATVPHLIGWDTLITVPYNLYVAIYESSLRLRVENRKSLITALRLHWRRPLTRSVSSRPTTVAIAYRSTILLQKSDASKGSVAHPERINSFKACLYDGSNDQEIAKFL